MAGRERMCMTGGRMRVKEEASEGQSNNGTWRRVVFQLQQEQQEQRRRQEQEQQQKGEGGGSINSSHKKSQGAAQCSSQVRANFLRDYYRISVLKCLSFSRGSQNLLKGCIHFLIPSFCTVVRYAFVFPPLSLPPPRREPKAIGKIQCRNGLMDLLMGANQMCCFEFWHCSYHERRLARCLRLCFQLA